MKFTVNKKKLEKIVGIMVKSIPARGEEVYKNFNFSVEDGILYIIASQSGFYTEMQEPVNMIFSGTASVDAKKFEKTLKSVNVQGVEDVCIYVDQGILYVEQMQQSEENEEPIAIKVGIKDLVGSQYPKFPDYDLKGQQITIPSKEWIMGVKKTSFSTLVSESRPSFAGIYHDVKDGLLNLVSTDGHRISVATMEVESTDTTNYLIRAEHAIIMSKLLTASKESSLVMYLSADYVVVKTTLMIIYLPLIKERFISYNRLLDNADVNLKINMDRDLLLQLLERGKSILDRQQIGIANLNVRETEMEIVVDNGTGILREKIPVTVMGKPTTMRINLQYLYDCIKMIDGERINCFVAENTILFTGLGKRNYRHIILPIL